jgi:acyl CoA:acetate/3-ketoacid CoA transferase beta subunit
MQHTDRSGKSKLVRRCSLPLTGEKCVQRIVTELAVIDVLPGEGFYLREVAPGHSVNDVIRVTEGRMFVRENTPEIEF